jgi:hypothetical protein
MRAHKADDLLNRLTWPELMRAIRLQAPGPGRLKLEAEAARRERLSRPPLHRATTISRPSRLNSPQ